MDVRNVSWLVLALWAIAGAGAATATDRRCLRFSGTDDGLGRKMAIEASRKSLEEAITKWKAENHVEAAVGTAAKPTPHPYWRRTVCPGIQLNPDEVTDSAYTICWQGVVSPIVCTSGANLCCRRAHQPPPQFS
jgi:hypothetical protein